MAEAAKLEIHLSEAFPHLAHAPIVEAIIEIRARALVPWEEAAISQKLKPQLPEYPKIVSRTQSPLELELGPGQPQSVVRDLDWLGLEFQSTDQKCIARFARDGFRFARLQPYENWERLLGEAMRLWQMHVEVAQPLVIHRVGLRFINRIEMRQGELRSEACIKLPPEPLEGLDLPLVGFFHQDTLAFPGHPLAINVIRTIQPPQAPETGNTAVILDIDVSTTKSIQVNQDKLVEHLRQMRWLKNKVFFGSITQKALSMYK